MQALDIERFENRIIQITSILSPTLSYLSLLVQLLHVLITNYISFFIVIANDRFVNLPEATLIIIIAITYILSFITESFDNF